MKTKTFYVEELSPFCCHFSFLTNEPRLLNYFLSMGTNRTPTVERRGSRIKGGLLYFNSRFVPPCAPSYLEEHTPSGMAENR